MTKNQTLLLVEDDLDIHAVMKEVLEGAGYTVVSMWNGQEALDYLKDCQELPFLIFLDQHMPVKSGSQFREDQLKDRRLAQIPVIMITADGKIEEKMHSAPPVGIIKKPFALEALLSEVARVIRKQ